MILNCPHCGIAQAEGDGTCINCGQPLKPAPAAPLADPARTAEAARAAHPTDHAAAAPDPVRAAQTRRSSWMPALVAAALLLALAASALLVARRRPARHAAVTALASRPPAVPPAPAASPPSPAIPVPAAPAPKLKAPVGAAASAVPLTITLASTRDGRHVKVGDGVTFTAFVSPEHGRSATLTLFSRRGRGPKTMLSFVQGSLCSTTWVSPAPGRYEFTATALDGRQRAASRHVEVTVDAPQVAAREVPRAPSARVAAAPRRAVRPSPRIVSRPKAVPPKVVPPRTAARAPAPSYHVAAARFYFLRSATVLADALNQRGYHAVPERMNDPRGKAVYAVVTGTFRRPKEARAAALVLQRSGYPAYVFGSR